MFYLTTHSTHFIYGYMASDIWLRTILIVRKETRCRHIGYSYRLTARVLLYAPSHRQDNTYHGLCYTSRGALAGTRNSSMGPPHEGSIRRPTAPWANALPLSYVPLLSWSNAILQQCPFLCILVHLKKLLVPFELLSKTIFFCSLHGRRGDWKQLSTTTTAVDKWSAHSDWAYCSVVQIGWCDKNIKLRNPTT